MNARRPLRTERRGLASLEFTLALPIMLLFASAVLMVGRAGLARTAAAVSARRHSWDDRATLQSGDELNILWNAAAGSESARVDRSYKGWVGAGGANPTATSKHTIFGGTWDHHGVKFETNRGLFTPHLSVLGRMATFGGQNLGNGVESTVGKFTKAFEAIITNQAVLAAGGAANTAIKGAGYWLQFTLLPPLKAIDVALEVADWVPFVDLGTEISIVGVLLNSVDGLVEASKERPGTWLPDKLKKIAKVFNL
jgi:hypothetical protein